MFVTDGPGSAAYDCVVIGSGPAGLTVALELERAAKRVLVLESGDDGPARTLANSIGYGHYSGTYWNAHWVRAFGGTSAVWSGYCTTLCELDFDNPSVGVRWPIGRGDLLPYYRQAVSILDRDPSIVDFEAPFLSGFVYRPFSREDPTRFAEKYGDVLRRSERVDVALGCSAVGFDADEARRTVRTVHWFHHRSGTARQLNIVPPQSVVLASGGIGNAQLLLQPRSEGAAPVGNERGQAGKFIMEHPHFYNAAECVMDEGFERVAPPEEFGRHVSALIAGRELARDRGLYGCSVEFDRRTTEHEMAGHFAGAFGRPFYHYVINLRAEMLPSPGNRVFLTGERDRSGLYRPAVRCVLDARDFLNVEMTLRAFGESLIAAQKGRVRINNDRIYRNVNGGGHIMGTTAMGTSSSSSVVDRDCRVHGYDNLFVAGSSVFPSGGYANPTLTIVALAVRLAERLAG